MKIFSKLLLVMVLFTGAGLMNVANGQGKIKGKVVDKYNEVVAGAKVILYKDGGFENGAITDDEGTYQFSFLSPATYDLYITYGEDSTVKRGIVLSVGETRPLDIAIGDGGYTTGTVDIVAQGEFAPPLFTVDPIGAQTVTIQDIKDRGVRDLTSILGASAGIFQSQAGGAIQVRGGRTGGTVTFIDGVKMVGTPGVPQPMYGQVSLITGGLPAEYGDVSGGVISVTTRNPGMKGWVGTPARVIRKRAKAIKKKHNATDNAESMDLVFANPVQSAPRF